MIKVCFVRGKYLNNFEGQNYVFKNVKFSAVSSLFPLNKEFPFPVIKLPSLADLPGRVIKYLGNRILGDSQILLRLESMTDKFDIFQTADPHYYYSYQLAKLRKKSLIKNLIVTSWETIPFNNVSVRRKKEIKYFTLSQADFFICYTEKAKKVLIKEGVNPKKIKVIKLGIDIDKFKPNNDKITRSRNFVNEDLLTILFVGRLVEEKGIMDLYEAFKNIKSKPASWRIKLKIIGDGSLKLKIQSLIEADGLENLVSIEKKDYREMPEVYREADILVLPSKKTNTWEEQYGMVLVEAMASGLPIIAYNIGAIPEVVDNAGILIMDGNVKNLTVSLKKLLASEDLRRKLGKIGRERAEKYFDANRTAIQIKKLYKKVFDYKS